MNVDVILLNVKTRTTSHFLTPDDDALLSARIQESHPNVIYIDTLDWSKTQDVNKSRRDSIVNCGTNAYIWDPDSVPDLPANNKFTYHAAHFSRCRLTADDELYLGQTGLLLDPDCETQSRFCNSILRTIRGMASGPLDALKLVDDSVVNTKIQNFITGPDAYNRAGEDLTLVYADNYYRPSGKNAG